MTGRPPTPEKLKAIEGHRGHRTRAELQARLVAATEVDRGRPPFPPELTWSESDEPALDAPVAEIREALERRRRIDTASAHWEYLCDELMAAGLLAKLDQGSLLAACLAFALMGECGRRGDLKGYDMAAARYCQLADRMGLNESARARMPREKKSADKNLEDAMCA